MTPPACTEVIAHCGALWRFARNWTDEQTKAAIDGLKPIDISAECARLALNELARTTDKTPTLAAILRAVKGAAPRIIVDVHRWETNPPEFGADNHGEWFEYVSAVSEGLIEGGPVNKDVMAYAVSMLRDTGSVPTWAECVSATADTAWKPTEKQPQIAPPALADQTGWDAMVERVRAKAGMNAPMKAEHVGNVAAREVKRMERGETFEAEIDRAIAPAGAWRKA